MSKHEKFHFRTREDLVRKAAELGLDIPFDDGFSVLFERTSVAGKILSNRIAALPMEGADAEDSGAPGELTFRRYRRYAAGGNGLIWFEATAVTDDGRSNPRQLYLNDGTLDGFKRLVEATREAAREGGASASPLLVLQLTHAGRNARPVASIARPNPILESVSPLPENRKRLDDDDLDRMQDSFVRCAVRAHESGFDAVDVKACHGYLVNELLASFTRENSRYGGSFENRSRFLRETVQKIRDRLPGLLVFTRISASDFIPHPYGFGVGRGDVPKEDLSEPKMVIDELTLSGLSLVGVSMGIPRFAPHIVRPFDSPLKGGSIPGEHPLEGVARLIRVTGELQRRFPRLPFVSGGYSWLRQFWPYIAAAVIRKKMATLIGLGRESLAYPDSVRDLETKGRLDPRKACTTCSSCSQLLRDGGRVGCIVRDKEVY